MRIYEKVWKDNFLKLACQINWFYSLPKKKQKPRQ